MILTRSFTAGGPIRVYILRNKSVRKRLDATKKYTRKKAVGQSRNLSDGFFFFSVLTSKKQKILHKKAKISKFTKRLQLLLQFP